MVVDYFNTFLYILQYSDNHDNMSSHVDFNTYAYFNLDKLNFYVIKHKCLQTKQGSVVTVVCKHETDTTFAIK